MSNNDMTLVRQLREAINKKELASGYEVIDDTITADLLDAQSDAMLNELNAQLVARIAPDKYEELPARAKLLIQQLGQLYCKLYAEVNTESDSNVYSSIMSILKAKLSKIMPNAFLSSIAIGALSLILNGSKKVAVFALLGWLLSFTIASWSLAEVETLPVSAQRTLQQIKETEAILSSYGIEFKPVNINIPLWRL